MQCEAFERRLQELLDNRQRPEFDPQLLRHSELCHECAKVLAAQELMFSGLREDAWEELDECFAERVVQQSLNSPVGGSSAGVKLLVAAAMAAMLLLMFSPAWLSRRLNQPDGRMQALLQPMDLVEGPAGQPVASLPTEPAVISRHSSPAGPLQIDTLAHALYIDSFGTLLLELPDGTLAPVDQLTGSLRPLASSFSVAFDALRRSFPLGWESRHEKRRAATSMATGAFV